MTCGSVTGWWCECLLPDAQQYFHLSEGSKDLPLYAGLDVSWMPFTCSGTHAVSCFDPWPLHSLKFLGSLSNSTFWQQRDRHGWSYQNSNIYGGTLLLIHPGSSCMATALCMPHPPAASTHFSSTSCSSWTCVHDWKFYCWLIHCFSTFSNSVPDLLLFLVPLHSGLTPFTSKAMLGMARNGHIRPWDICWSVVGFALFLLWTTLNIFVLVSLTTPF